MNKKIVILNEFNAQQLIKPGFILNSQDSLEKINFGLIWVDSSIHSSENQSYQQQFKNIFLTVELFISTQQYQDFMFQQANQTNDRYFLLTSGALGKELNEIAQLHSKIIYAFVFCSNVQYHSTWAQNFPKIKLVTNELQTLFEHFKSYYKIEKFLEIDQKAAYHFSHQDQIQNYFVVSTICELCILKGNLDKQKAIEDFKLMANNFIQSQQNFGKYQNDLKEIVSDLNNINQNTKMITWFTQETFFYRMLNTILRKGDLMEIFNIRIAIYELSMQLRNFKIEIKNYPKVLYRGTIMNKGELELCKQDSNKYPIMWNGFISSMEQKEKAEEFCHRAYTYSKNQSEISPVLFEISTEEIDQSLRPPQISSVSIYQNEKEYLFKINTFLMVENIQQKHNLTIIKAKIIKYDEIAQKLPKLSLSRFTQIKKSLKKNYNIPELYFLSILQEISNWKLMVEVLNKIENQNQMRQFYYFSSIAYQGIGELKKSLEFAHKLLEINQKQFADNHKKIGKTYLMLSDIYLILREQNKAKEFSQKAYEIFQHHSNCNDQISNCYDSLSRVYLEIGEKQQSLEYCLKAKDLRKKQCDDEDRNISASFSLLGQIYLALNEQQKANECTVQGMEIRKKQFGENHLLTAASYHEFGFLQLVIGQSKKALEYSKKALEIRENLVGINHIDTAISYLLVGNIYQVLGQVQLAASFHNKGKNLYKQIIGRTDHQLITSFKNSIQSKSQIKIIKQEVTIIQMENPAKVNDTNQHQQKQDQK